MSVEASGARTIDAGSARTSAVGVGSYEGYSPAVSRAIFIVMWGLWGVSCASSERVATISDDYEEAGRCLDDSEAPTEVEVRVKRLATCRVVCDKGVAAGCWMLGRSALVGTQRDTVVALAEFDRGCTLGDAASCVEAGVLAERGAEGRPGDATLALRYYRTACDRDHPTGCSNLGLIFQLGEVVPRDEVRASQLYQRGCTGGDAAGCANLAFLLHYGIGVSKNDKRARELYEEACKRRHTGACGNLATMLLAGRGGEREPERAVGIYEGLCKDGVIEGCSNLGVLVESGTGVARDVVRAKALYEQGCAAGISDACLGLGRLFEAAGGDSLHEAARLYRRVCGATSEREACDRFERVKRALDAGEKGGRP